ncbi:MAG: NAD(P)H-dependent oxidoreductase [Clostridium sp.]|nr:NAD(P)H-dependent oxidoreductase [Clostridium sp.]
MALNILYFDLESPDANAVPEFDPDAAPNVDETPADRLSPMLFQVLMDTNAHILQNISELREVPDKCLLFALPLNDVGMNKEYTMLLARLRREPHLLDGCTAGIIVDGPSELYTTPVAAEFAMAITMAGGSLIGHPLVEATGSLSAFAAQAEAQSCSREDAYLQAIRELAGRLEASSFPRKALPNLLTLCTASQDQAATEALWSHLAPQLAGFCQAEECCLDQESLEELCASVQKADAVLLLCTNRNGLLPPEATALIHRLTGEQFENKPVFAAVVSPCSGGDMLARQLLTALNLNGPFRLPGEFALLQTGSEPDEDDLDEFVQSIRQTLCQ